MRTLLTGSVLLALQACCNTDSACPTQTGFDSSDTELITSDTATSDPDGSAPPLVVEADLTDPVAVQALAGMSAAQVAANPTALFLAGLISADPLCPTVTVVGDTTFIDGGCVTSAGIEWTGHAESIDSGKLDYLDLVFDGYGTTQLVPCDNGGAVLGRTRMSGTGYEFSDGTFQVDWTGTLTRMDLAACTSQEHDFTLDYTGKSSVVGTSYLFDGEGVFDSTLWGRVEAETFSELVDTNVCGTEALSGVTVLRTSTTEARLQYDGAADCDADSTVQWELDGVDQGELSGVACATGPLLPRWWASSLVLALGAAGLRRRAAKRSGGGAW
jgi:hypothetical protein